MNQEELQDHVDEIDSLKELVKFFHELGVRGQLLVCYDGHGDSGQISSYDYDQISHNRSEIEKFEEKIDDLLYDLLPPGWEINEGSSGEVVIDFDDQNITINHNWIVTETQIFEY